MAIFYTTTKYLKLKKSRKGGIQQLINAQDAMPRAEFRRCGKKRASSLLVISQSL
jgi:hypothetical protein